LRYSYQQRGCGTVTSNSDTGERHKESLTTVAISVDNSRSRKSTKPEAKQEVARTR